MNKQYTIIEILDVMKPYRKLYSWKLWQINVKNWTPQHWKEFESVKAGNKPKLLNRSSERKNVIIFRYIATHKVTGVTIEDTAFGLAKAIGCIRQRICSNNAHNWEITKLN